MPDIHSWIGNGYGCSKNIIVTTENTSIYPSYTLLYLFIVHINSSNELKIRFEKKESCNFSNLIDPRIRECREEEEEE